MSNDQRDAVTMLHLRDTQLPISYSETNIILPSNSMMHTNFSSSNPDTSHREILLNFGGSDSQDPSSSWKDGRNEMLLMHSMGGNSSLFERAHNFQGQQGLSLSLGTHVIHPIMQASTVVQFQNESSILDGHNTALVSNEEKETSYNASIGGNIPDSKYLKAAQELFDEVVNVKKAFFSERNVRNKLKISKENDCKLMDGNFDGELTVTPKPSGSEISSSEKQELQNKLTKLLLMLDEVDRRYRQYYHQMQIVVSSFDVIAGSGSAKPYTSLALQTISRHFRCLRDAINGQIHVVRKNLGEEDSSCSNDKGGIGISRLRYVDQQIRQQRALQQLGMMQPHTWRPQRGLPGTSVLILRAWLFEHFLHPYPKDSDKIMLARQTGLTRSQVSNWFINARVRLWKPMIEEMYREEAGETADVDSNSSAETIPATPVECSNPKVLLSDGKVGEDHLQQSATSMEMHQRDSNMNHVEMNGGSDTNPVFQYLIQTEPSNSYYVKQQNETNKPSIVFPNAILQSNCGEKLFGGYDVSELKRLGSVSGGISLTLGLQQCEGVGGGNNMAVVDRLGRGFVQVTGNNDDIHNTGSFSYGCP